MTDPYAAPAPVTREIWEALTSTPPELRPRRVVIQSRFRADRDEDLLADYERTSQPSDSGPAVLVSLSVGTDDDAMIGAWEKSTPLFEHRMKTIEALRDRGVWVVPTLSPFGRWRDLPAALGRFDAWGVAYVTLLFFKQRDPRSRSATTPRRFLEYLARTHPELLDADWQNEHLELIASVLGRDRVIEGQPGFETLTAPHRVAIAGSG